MIMVSTRLPIWPTRVLMSVFLSLISLCSETFICDLIISADVNGLFNLINGVVKPNPPPQTKPELGLGEEGLEFGFLGDTFFTIFNPKALFTLLVAAKPKPFVVVLPPLCPIPPLSPVQLSWINGVLPPKPGDDLHAVKKISYAVSLQSSLSRPSILPKGHSRSKHVSCDSDGFDVDEVVKENDSRRDWVW